MCMGLYNIIKTGYHEWGCKDIMRVLFPRHPRSYSIIFSYESHQAPLFWGRKYSSIHAALNFNFNNPVAPTPAQPPNPDQKLKVEADEPLNHPLAGSIPAILLPNSIEQLVFYF